MGSDPEPVCVTRVQILDLWLIAHRVPRLARLFLAVPSCAIAGYANSLVASALWARDGPDVRIETSTANFDPQARAGGRAANAPAGSQGCCQCRRAPTCWLLMDTRET